jgi:hypothetical protein
MTADEPETEGLTCREVVGLRADYLESALGQERIDELEEHPGGMRAVPRLPEHLPADQGSDRRNRTRRHAGRDEG